MRQFLPPLPSGWRKMQSLLSLRSMRLKRLPILRTYFRRISASATPRNFAIAAISSGVTQTYPSPGPAQQPPQPRHSNASPPAYQGFLWAKTFTGNSITDAGTLSIFLTATPSGKKRNETERLGTIWNETEPNGTNGNEWEPMGTIGKVSKTRKSLVAKHLRILPPKITPFLNSPLCLSCLNCAACRSALFERTVNRLIG